MSARIAPEPIATVNTGISDYRPRTPPPQPAPAAPAAESDSNQPHSAASLPTSARDSTAEPPPLPEPIAPGTAYVLAVISGALSPRPTSLHELFKRTGTGWVPPDSSYRLTDKII